MSGQKGDFAKSKGTEKHTQDGMPQIVLVVECVWRVQWCVHACVCACACVCVYTWEYKHVMTLNKEARKITKDTK